MADSSLAALLELPRPTVRSLSTGALFGSSSFIRTMKVRFLYSVTSVPALGGHQLNQFQPKPFQSLPSACHSRPTELFVPEPGVILTVLLHASFRLQLDHSLALPPCSSPSQTTDTSSFRSTEAACFPKGWSGNGLMQFNETTRAAAINSDTKVQVLVSECDITILSACSVADDDIPQGALEVEFRKGLVIRWFDQSGPTFYRTRGMNNSPFVTAASLNRCHRGRWRELSARPLPQRQYTEHAQRESGRRALLARRRHRQRRHHQHPARKSSASLPEILSGSEVTHQGHTLSLAFRFKRV